MTRPRSGSAPYLNVGARLSATIPGQPALRSGGHALALACMPPWLLAVLFLLSVAALTAIIRAVMLTVRAARLCAVPLRPQQEIEFSASGKVVLCMEGPRFTPRFRALDFELGPTGGAPLADHRILFRTVGSGVSQARMTLRSYRLPMPGRYQLDIHGLDPQYVDAPGHTVVFMRPHLAQTVLFVVGITLASALAIVSLVFLLLAVIPNAAAIDSGRVAGYVLTGETRIELREAYAHLHRGHSDQPPREPELRLVFADREIPQATLAGSDVSAVLERARAGGVRGLLIELNPDDPGTVTLTLLMPLRSADDGFATRQYRAAADPVLRNLRLSPQRVGGDLACPPSDDLGCAAHFSAPLFTD
jgi:hypothetical protein